MSTYEDYPDPAGIRVLERLSDCSPGCVIAIHHLPAGFDGGVCKYKWTGIVNDQLGKELFRCCDCDSIGELLFSLSISLSDYKRST
jgi:hypothetical protein